MFALESCASAGVESANAARKPAASAELCGRILGLDAGFGFANERAVVELPGMKAGLVIGEIVACHTSKHSWSDEEVMKHLEPRSRTIHLIRPEKERHASEQHVEKLHS